MEILVIALFLATVNMAIVDYLAQPVKQKYPRVDFWWLQYVALATGAVIGYIADVNLFAAYFTNAEMGRVLTSVLIGGGSGLIHRVFDK